MSTLDVLYRDARVLVVDKPSGMLVHRGMDDDPVVVMTLARDLVGARVHPVHRLDRGTSGVVVLALDPAAASALGGAFERGEVEKSYVAIVRGLPLQRFDVDSPVPRTEGGALVPARTSFERLAVGAGYAVVRARPHTGRFHQIRRHLRHVRHPIVGDTNYGDGRHNRFFREHMGLARLALHAERLVFPHPETGANVQVTSPIPEAFRVATERLFPPLQRELLRERAAW